MQESELSIKTIIKGIRQINKSRRDFLHHVLVLILSIPGRVNFMQLGRYSDTYVESTCRLQFEQYVDFQEVNQQYILQNGSGHYLLAFDPSYVVKRGKATPGLDKYWSGKAQQALWGLEAGLLSVIDMEHQSAFHLDVVQTPNKEERTRKDISLVDHYVQVILWAKERLPALSNYLAVDGYFAKADFINPILERTPLHIISCLRTDANLYYRYEGQKRLGRGAPKKYDGKINCKAPDLSRFTLQHQDDRCRIYDAIVYCKFLKRNIRLAYTQYLNPPGKPNTYKLYFTTDLNLPAWMIVSYYTARFHQEFLIRDAKQHTGLQHCQARSINKIEYHWNAALTAVNVAKFEHWLHHNPKTRGPFSLRSIKIRYYNHLILNRIFDILPQYAHMLKINPKFKELYYFGTSAA